MTRQTALSSPVEPAAAPDPVARTWPLIAILATTSVLGVLNLGGLNAFLPFIADDVETSVPVLGQITTIVFLIGAAGGLVIGPLADRFGQRRFQMCGAVLVILASLGTAIATSFGTLLVARLISALSGGMLQAVTLASAATIFTGDERRKAMSWVIGGMAGGPIVGIPLLTLIASVSSWRVSFVALAAFAVVVLLLQRAILPADRAAAHHSPLHVRLLLDAYRPLLRSRATLALYAANFTRAIAWVGFLTYFGVFLHDMHGLDEREIGWGYMVGGAGYFAGSLLAGGRLGDAGLRPLFALTTTLMGGVVVATLAAPFGPVVAIGLTGLVGLVGSASFVSLTTLLATTSPAGRSTTMTLNSTAFALGSAGGGAVGGGLIALSGYTALAIGLAGFSVLSVLLVWRPGWREVFEPSIEPAR
jgi:DHA1 family inner membrane transport protein